MVNNLEKINILHLFINFLYKRKWSLDRMPENQNLNFPISSDQSYYQAIL